MDFIGLLRTLERITRQATRPTFSDTDDPLTDEMRAEGWECTAIPEPALTPDELVGVRGLLQERYEPNFGGASRWGGQTYTSVCLHRAPHYVIPTGRDHQCYCARPQDHPLDDYGYRPHICRCGELWADLPTKSSASNHAGPGAEPALGEEPEESLTASLAHPPGYYALMTDTFASNLYGFPDRPTAGDEHTASDGGKWIYELLGTRGVWDATNYPSPTIVQSAPPPTVDGEGPPADSGIPPSPAGERPPHPVPREQRQGTYCEDYETDGCSVDVCPDGCYHALKFRDDAAAEWIGEAVPVISEVLGDHRFLTTVGQCSCPCDSRETPPRFTQSTWREHVAPLIANALAPQPMSAFPRSDFAKGVDAAANIVGEEAQKVWRQVLDSPVTRPAFDGMNVACRLDSLTQQLRDHANEYSK